MSTLTTPLPTVQVKAPAIGAPRQRTTPLWARGEPMVWLTGTALGVCIVMIAALLCVVIYHGAVTFWPRAIDRVTLADGKVFLGVPMRDEAYDPGDDERGAVEKLTGAASEGPAGTLIERSSGRPIRRMYRVGNKEVTGQPFAWVPLYQIAAIDRPAHATLLERTGWGVWLGEPTSVLDVRGSERTVMAQGDAAWAKFQEQHPIAVARAARIKALQEHEIGRVNKRIENERLELREAELQRRQTRADRPGVLSWGGWSVLAAGTIVLLGVTLGRTRGRMAAPTSAHTPWSRLGQTSALGGLWALLIAGGLGVWLMAPWRSATMSDEQYAGLVAAKNARAASLNAEYQQILAQIQELDALDATQRVIFTDPGTGRFAPTRQTEPTEPMRISQVVRAIQPNELTWWGKLGVYADRWREFLLDEPRESNQEGGVFPIIFGTVLLTLLLAVAVVPLGVIAAIYLREYATQGIATSAIRVAVNNLAGVPSIVYGVFGYGFFITTVGHWVDRGPGVNTGVPGWWIGLGLALTLGVLAAGLGAFAKPQPGSHTTRPQRWAALTGAGLWFFAVGGAVAMIAFSPYFGGFFSAKAADGSPTFGSRGLLWSSLTLALLTLPVVIVATEEAIAAVPRSMREGSYGCGASKWQTIVRIVLPRALPGIMTGAILAMARGAGEVAPLMLVGVVKKASELPVSAEFPFIHLDQAFMHLGFHIYDVGFQSPDSEAARPLVWCTTLLLILVVVLLNVTAIRLRANLRKKYLGETF